MTINHCSALCLFLFLSWLLCPLGYLLIRCVKYGTRYYHSGRRQACYYNPGSGWVALEVASNYNNINRIIIRFDEGVYRQSQSVKYPSLLGIWPGSVYIAPASNASVTFSGASPVTAITALGKGRCLGVIPPASYYAMLAHWTRESHDDKSADLRN